MEGWTDGWMDEQTDKGENEKLLKIMEQLPTSPGSGAACSVVCRARGDSERSGEREKMHVGLADRPPDAELQPAAATATVRPETRC